MKSVAFQVKEKRGLWRKEDDGAENGTRDNVDLESKWIDDGVSGRCGHAGQVWEEEAKGEARGLV